MFARLPVLTELKKSILRNDIPALQQLLQSSQELFAKYRESASLLHFAVRFGRVESLVVLNSAKLIDLNHQDERGNTALHIAIEHNKMVEGVYLIKQGANVDIANRIGYKPSQNTQLMTAYNNFNVDIKRAIEAASREIAEQKFTIAATCKVESKRLNPFYK